MSHLGTAAGFTKDGDVLRVAAKGGNVMFHPFEGIHKVYDSNVGRILILGAIFFKVEMTGKVQAVIHGNNNHITATAEVGAVISG